MIRWALLLACPAGLWAQVGPPPVVLAQPWASAPGALAEVRTCHVARIDADTLPDVLANDGSQIVVFEADAPDHLAEVFRTPLADGSATVTALASGDTDGDGLREIIAGDAALGIRVYEARSNDLYDLVASLPVPSAAGSGEVLKVLVTDLDADGHGELVIASVGPEDRLTIYEHVGNTGTNTYGLLTSLSVPQGLTDIAAGDADNDGHLDIIQTTAVDQLSFVIVEANGADNGFTVSLLWSAAPAQCRLALVDDLDDDGLNELCLLGRVGAATGSLVPGFLVMEAATNNAYAVKAKVKTSWGGLPTAAASGLMKCSPYAVIAVGDPEGGLLAQPRLDLWRFNGSKYVPASRQHVSTASHVHDVHTASIDGDEDPDVLFIDAESDQVLWYEQRNDCHHPASTTGPPPWNGWEAFRQWVGRLDSILPCQACPSVSGTGLPASSTPRIHEAGSAH